MPSLLSVLLHPETRRPDPAPAPVDLARIILVGTCVWSAVLVGAGVAQVAGVAGASSWAWIAVAGVVLGLLGLLWSRRNRARWRSETA